VAIAPASTGDAAVFALSLAAIRLVLAAGYAAGGDRADLLRRRITRAYATSAVLFAVSAGVPGPFREVLWAIAIVLESTAMLDEDREAMHRLRRDRDLAALAPADPADALEAHHFAERFGLFLIILLGEVVVEAGQASVDGHVASFDGWMALIAAMVLAAALWWLYFDAAAERNLQVLELSGGSPTMAKAIYAVGHMLPSFALLLVAAGVGLLLEGEPPRLAYTLPAIGIGIYLLGTRVFLSARSHGARVLRLILLIAVFSLGRLHETLSPHAYLWLLSAVAVVCAALAMRGAREPQPSGTSSDPDPRTGTSADFPPVARRPSG
jgi:low temperature requirement protein LtrA